MGCMWYALTYIFHLSRLSANPIMEILSLGMNLVINCKLARCVLPTPYDRSGVVFAWLVSAQGRFLGLLKVRLPSAGTGTNPIVGIFRKADTGSWWFNWTDCLKRPYALRRLAHPTGFEPVTSAFGEQSSIKKSLYNSKLHHIKNIWEEFEKLIFTHFLLQITRSIHNSTNLSQRLNH